ncbi:hypothetical protein D3C78_1331780 [compost metagenome]
MAGAQKRGIADASEWAGTPVIDQRGAEKTLPDALTYDTVYLGIAQPSNLGFKLGEGEGWQAAG